MIENWFTNKCMALVGENGRALSGEALKAAETGICQAKASNCKIWTDRNGFLYCKERKLFAKAQHLLDSNGNPVRICGKPVKIKAKFCSKCGSPAPGGWWRCGGCGEHIGNESKTCPHCGRSQNLESRLDLRDGNWQKSEDVFAERFELAEVASLLPKGLNIQESQRAILIEGGAVTDVLESGFYKTPDLTGTDGADRSLVLVDAAEFSLPVCVGDVRTKDDLKADLHTILTLRFNKDSAKNFMQNLMGSSMYLLDDAVTAALGYDEVANCILQNIDGAVRDFCNRYTVSDLFKNADIRIDLENFIEERIKRNLDAIGLGFIRLKSAEFESEVFAELREKSGQLEAKRLEIEFMKRADELANDATRREAMREYEMEDYMNQLAHEKGIKDELRIQELERMKTVWKHSQEKAVLNHEHDLDDIQQQRQLDRDRRDLEFAEEEKNLKHRAELARMIEQQKSSLDFINLETQIQDIRLEMDKKKVKAEQEAAVDWLKIKQQKEEFQQAQKIEKAKALAGADLQTLLAMEDDPEKRADLLRLHEQELQSRMTPELLLAAAAARGNPAAADALSHLGREQVEIVEKSKQENKEMYERMLQMSERMFNKTAESMSKASSGSNTTTQIIK